MLNQSADDGHAPSPPRPFLEDARENLLVVRRAHGPYSPPYRRLVRHCRRVARELGQEREFERMLHRLRRRSAVEVRLPWRARPHSGPAS